MQGTPSEVYANVRKNTCGSKVISLNYFLVFILSMHTRNILSVCKVILLFYQPYTYTISYAKFKFNSKQVLQVHDYLLWVHQQI